MRYWQTYDVLVADLYLVSQFEHTLSKLLDLFWSLHLTLANVELVMEVMDV